MPELVVRIDSPSVWSVPGIDDVSLVVLGDGGGLSIGVAIYYISVGV